MSSSPIGPVFIVGVARSGTTLLVNLIGSHPLVAPIYETRFLRNLLLLCEKACWFWGNSLSRKFFSLFWEYPARSYFLAQSRKFREKALSFGTSPPHGPSVRQPYESFPFGHGCILYEFDEFVRETDLWLKRIQTAPLSCDGVYGAARQYIDRLFSVHCSRMNRPYWINKTPGLLNHLHRLPELYPKAKCIHILRDGRDVAVSSLSLSWGPANVRDAARRWKKLILDGRKGVDPKNLSYMEIRYEELIKSPREVLKNVFAFVELDADLGEVLSHIPVFGGRAGVWPAVFSPEDRRIFAKEAGDLLIELGYEKDYSWVG